MNCIFYVLFVSLLGLIVSAQLATLIRPRCGANEEYLTCGSACPPTCEDFRYPLPKPPKFCILLCKTGCFCKKGFFRAADGSCVLPEQCCGENEIYKKCGSACIETCDMKPMLCTRQCVPGCFCACSDYVRQSNSTGSPCIPREKCPEPCEEDPEPCEEDGSS